MSREYIVKVEGITGFKKPRVVFLENNFPSCVSKECPIKPGSNEIKFIVEDGCTDVCVEGFIVDDDCKGCGNVFFKRCISTDGTCPDGQKFVDGFCVDVCSDKDVKHGKVNINGICQCPLDKPYFDELQEKCVQCESGKDHPTNKCLKCVNGAWQQKDCDGTCIPETGECVPNCPSFSRYNTVTKECECVDGYTKDINDNCVPVPPTCSACEDLIDGVCVPVDCGPGRRCVNGDCIDWPCEDVPCNNGADCGTDCGCKDGECVPCATLSCDECAATYGCECVDGVNCQAVTDPCKNYPCPDDCASRPECGCNEDGKNVEGKPLLTDDDNESVNNQEELTSGALRKVTTYNYRGLASNVLHQEEVVEYSTRSLVEGQGFISDSTYSNGIDVREFESNAVAPVDENDQYVLREIVVSYYLSVDARNSRNGCSYLKRKVAEFKFTAVDLLDTYKTVENILSSSDCSKPEFIYYRGVETTPFRKKYVSKDSDGNYTDFIAEDPRQNSFITDDTAVDQHNDLISGLPYRVYTRCGCDVGELQEAKRTFDCDTVYFCENCDARFELKDLCGAKVNLIEDFVASCRLNRELTGQDIANNYAEEQQVVWTVTVTDINGATREFNGIGNWSNGLVWTKDFEFETDGTTPIQSVGLKMNHDTCEKCVITQDFTNQLPDVPYETDCKIAEDVNGNIVKTFIVSLLPFPAGVVGATVLNATADSSGTIFEITVAEAATQVILTVQYDGGCTKDQIIPITANCQINFETEQDVPECGSTNDLRLVFRQSTTNILGTTTWKNGLGTVVGTGEEILINPNLTTGGLNPNYVTPFTVEFVPDSSVFDSVSDTFNVNLTTVTTVNPTTGTTNEFSVCGTDDYEIDFAVDCDNAIVSYTLSGDGNTYTATTNNGIIKLVVKYNGGNSNTATITDIQGQQGCCIDLEPKVFTVNWSEGCTVNSFGTTLDTICEGDDLPITIDGSGNCNLLFKAYNTLNQEVFSQFIALNSTTTNYTLSNLPSGNLTIVLDSIVTDAGTECESVNNAQGTVVGIEVLSTGSISSSLVSCVGDSTGLNTYVVRVLNELNQPVTDAVITPVGATHTGNGNYTGTVSANTTLSISVPNRPVCVQTTAEQNINCGCDTIPSPTTTGCRSDTVTVGVVELDELQVIINNNTNGTETVCENDNVTFASTVIGGSASYLYSWTKDGNSTVIGTNANLNLTNVDSTSQGTYTLNVVDQISSCTGTANITLIVDNCNPCLNSTLAVTLSQNNGECADITSFVSGGVAPFNYQWSVDGVVEAGQTSNVFDSSVLPAGFNGQIAVLVTDANGCEANTSVQHVRCAISEGIEVSNPFQMNCTNSRLEGTVTFRVPCRGLDDTSALSLRWELNGAVMGSLNFPIVNLDDCARQFFSGPGPFVRPTIENNLQPTGNILKIVVVLDGVDLMEVDSDPFDDCP